MDKYTRAVRYYVKHRHKISKDWSTPIVENHSVLFGYLSKSREIDTTRSNETVGCPAMVAYDKETSKWVGYEFMSSPRKYVAQTKKLTELVRKIKNIPDPDIMHRHADKVTEANLKALATAQRLADKLLKR